MQEEIVSVDQMLTVEVRPSKPPEETKDKSGSLVHNKFFGSSTFFECAHAQPVRLVEAVPIKPPPGCEYAPFKFSEHSQILDAAASGKPVVNGMQRSKSLSVQAFNPLQGHGKGGNLKGENSRRLSDMSTASSSSTSSSGTVKRPRRFSITIRSRAGERF